MLARSHVIGNFEIINSIKEFYNDKKILDVCAASGGKSILLSTYGFMVEALPLTKVKNCNFSFSGLKTSVAQLVHQPEELALR